MSFGELVTKLYEDAHNPQPSSFGEYVKSLSSSDIFSIDSEISITRDSRETTFEWSGDFAIISMDIANIFLKDHTIEWDENSKVLKLGQYFAKPVGYDFTNDVVIVRRVYHSVGINEMPTTISIGNYDVFKNFDVIKDYDWRIKPTLSVGIPNHMNWEIKEIDPEGS